MSFGRVFNILFVLAYVALGVFGLSYLYRENDALRVLEAKEAVAQERLDTFRSEVAQKREDLSRLKDDPEYIEQVIRTKLNYAKENELIYRFE